MLKNKRVLECCCISMLCIMHVLVLGRALQLEVTVPELQHGFLRAQPGASLPCQTQASPG